MHGTRVNIKSDLTVEMSSVISITKSNVHYFQQKYLYETAILYSRKQSIRGGSKLGVPSRYAFFIKHRQFLASSVKSKMLSTYTFFLHST
jgi:hypothetical protein